MTPLIIPLTEANAAEYRYLRYLDLHEAVGDIAWAPLYTAFDTNPLSIDPSLLVRVPGQLPDGDNEGCLVHGPDSRCDQACL